MITFTDKSRIKIVTHIHKDCHTYSIMSFSYLPIEVIHRILEYDGRVKYRNGKYINQISRNDERYELLKTITPPFVDIRFVPHGYVHYGYVARYSFRIEKLGCPYTSDNPLTMTDIGDEVRQYGYIQDDICYTWGFYPPKPVKSYFERLYSLLWGWLVPF